MNPLAQDAISLLKQLVQTPSLSREEDQTADIIADFFHQKGFSPQRKGNNVWLVSNLPNSENYPTILLNSHHDTVKPAKDYTVPPFEVTEGADGRLIGLGSNDAGASLVSLAAVFLHFAIKTENRPFNLIYAATAEEEISGKNGIASILSDLGNIDLGVVGEPTEMQLAIAEKGLMVIDGVVHGKAGHAAREEGENAIYKALPIINWFQTHQFERVSEVMGPVKMSLTQVKAGSQHNVVPDRCEFVVDVRVNECYQNEELFELIQQQVDCELQARSFRLNSSGISLNHPFVKKGKSLGLSTYGSPTLSDQALMPFTTVKIGPGDSARSHTADEFIFPHEIEAGIETYIAILDNLTLSSYE